MFLLCIDTDLAKVPNLMISAETEKTIKVNWTDAPGNWDGYIVECNCLDAPGPCSNNRSVTLMKPVKEYTCTNLTEGSNYTVTVLTVRNHWQNVSKSTFAKTSKILFCQFKFIFQWHILTNCLIHLAQYHFSHLWLIYMVHFRNWITMK